LFGGRSGATIKSNFSAVVRPCYRLSRIGSSDLHVKSIQESNIRLLQKWSVITALQIEEKADHSWGKAQGHAIIPTITAIVTCPTRWSGLCLS
jgi:hypothetical protein